MPLNLRPAVVAGVDRSFVRGVGKRDGSQRMLIVLDVRRVVDVQSAPALVVTRAARPRRRRGPIGSSSSRTARYLQRRRPARMLAVALVGSPGCLTIDLSNADRMHTAALQVLVALVTARAAAGLPCAWAGISATLAATLAMAGLDGVLQVPVDAVRYDAHCSGGRQLCQHAATREPTPSHRPATTWSRRWTAAMRWTSSVGKKLTSSSPTSICPTLMACI